MAKNKTETKLQKRRLEAGLRREALAAKAGVSLCTIVFYENRTRDIHNGSYCTLKKLADALGCGIEDIVE